MDPADVVSHVAEIDKVLQIPDLQVIEVEYKGYREGADPNWYSLFGGPECADSRSILTEQPLAEPYTESGPSGRVLVGCD